MLRNDALPPHPLPLGATPLTPYDRIEAQLVGLGACLGRVVGNVGTPALLFLHTPTGTNAMKTTTAAADLASLPAHSYAAVGRRVRDGESNEAILAAMPRLYDDNGNRLPVSVTP